MIKFEALEKGFKVWPLKKGGSIIGIITGKCLWVGKICKFTAASFCSLIEGLGLNVKVRLMFKIQEQESCFHL